MHKTTSKIFALVVAALAVAGVIYSRSHSVPRVDAGRLVVDALSQKNADYTALVRTETFYNGASVKSLATVYHLDNMERVEPSNDSDCKMWSLATDGKTYTFMPCAKKILVTEASKLLSAEARVRLLMKNYRAVCTGSDYIAGRPSYVIRLSPKYKGRSSKEMWIDAKNYVILKSIDYSADGDVRGTTTTEKIDFAAKPDPSKFALPSAKSADYTVMCRSGNDISLFKNLGFSVGTPHYLPKGYELEGYHLFNCKCSCGHHSAQLTYTDGLNIISVFQTPQMKSCRMCKMTNSEKAGNCSGRACGMATNGAIMRKDRKIIVVGDLLPEDVRKIAESVR